MESGTRGHGHLQGDLRTCSACAEAAGAIYRTRLPQVLFNCASCLLPSSTSGQKAMQWGPIQCLDDDCQPIAEVHQLLLQT